jgi:nitrogen-specific signal transduction histidine kinase
LNEISTDITEQKKLEAQLQQAQKMESIGTLAGGIAHDFNNILSPIMIHSEMAMTDLPSDSPLQFNLKEIYKAGERARDLVKQILTFSRKSEEERVALKITPIIKEILKMLRASIPTTIEIRQNFDAKSDTVLADPTRINQVMLNMATNAAHAMRKKGGILGISLVREELDSRTAARLQDLKPGPYLRLTVSDTGTGMDAETIQKIFEPYFTTKMAGEGTGMGLAMVHGIVKSFGGEITVESELGKGTTFNIYLPRIEESALPIHAKHSVQLPKGSESVLFVDDEKSMIDAIQPMLEVLGYKVTPRTSSIEALEAFKNDPDRFDIVITDMTMPNMTGKTLVKEILSIRSGIPIILCTGYSDQINKDEAETIGISAFLMKPIIMRDMANTIREVLEKKESILVL